MLFLTQSPCMWMLLHSRWGQPPSPNLLLPRLCKSGCAMRQTGQEGLDDKPFRRQRTMNCK
ncbi:hypothetical protein PO909_014775 [Leuciscus waleckii]